MTSGGPVVEAKTSRNYFLDYPCDLKRGEKVTFVLSLHGGGSYGNWQRHYFPIVDYKDKHRLVIATPFSPRRVWGAEDDEYLQNIVTTVVEQIGKENIKAFWLAGHSQGGLTSRRIVCSDFFATKVDGFLSLSGGRLGGAAPRAAECGSASGGWATPRPARPARRPARRRADATANARRATSRTSTRPASTRLRRCPIRPTGRPSTAAARARSSPTSSTPRPVTFSTAGDRIPGTKQWGLLPRPGKAEAFTYPSAAMAVSWRMSCASTRGTPRGWNLR